MNFEVQLTQEEYNAVMSALHFEIRKCYEAPKEDQEMLESYKSALESARCAMLSAWRTDEIP